MGFARRAHTIDKISSCLPFPLHQVDLSPWIYVHRARTSAGLQKSLPGRFTSFSFTPRTMGSHWRVCNWLNIVQFLFQKHHKSHSGRNVLREWREIVLQNSRQGTRGACNIQWQILLLDSVQRVKETFILTTVSVIGTSIRVKECHYTIANTLKRMGHAGGSLFSH